MTKLTARVLFCVVPATVISLPFFFAHWAVGLCIFLMFTAFGIAVTEPVPGRGEGL